MVLKSMTINGHQLPERLLDNIASQALRRAVGSWPMDSFDCYGHPLESELGELFGSVEDIQKETQRLAEDFAVSIDDGPCDCSDQPGYIDYIVDFSSIVAFATSGDGAPFCLDYRDTPDCPSVIWWDDSYWRRIAPSLDAFLGLLRLE